MMSRLRFVVCTFYTLLQFPTFSGWLRMRVSVLKLLGFLTSGTCQSFVTGHCHPLSTDSNDTMGFVVCASKKFTSCLLQIPM